MLKSYIDILRLPGAWQFSSAAAIMRLPMSMFSIAFVLVIKEVYESYTLAGAVAATQVISLSLVAPILSRAVDRYGQRAVMLPAMLLTSLSLIAFIGLTWWKAPISIIFIVAAVQGASWGAPGALVRSRWSQVVSSPSQLNTAYALEAAIDEVAYIAGPIMATVMGTALFPSAGLVAAVFFILIGSVGFFSQTSSEPKPHAVQSNERQRSVITIPVVVVLALTYIGAGAMFGATDLAVVAFTEKLGVQAMSGVLLGIFAFGSLIAALIYGARTWRSPLWKLFALGIVSLALGASSFLFATNLWMLGLAMVITGLTIAPTMTNVNMLIARAVPDRQLTEGLTWMSTAMNIGVSVGSMLGGVVVDSYSVHGGFVLVVICAWLMVALMLAGLRTVKQSCSTPVHEIISD